MIEFRPEQYPIEFDDLRGFYDEIDKTINWFNSQIRRYKDIGQESQKYIAIRADLLSRLTTMLDEPIQQGLEIEASTLPVLDSIGQEATEYLNNFDLTEETLPLVTETFDSLLQRHEQDYLERQNTYKPDEIIT